MIRDKIIFLGVCCAVVSFGEWNTYHGGADLRGVSEVAISGKPELLWRYAAGGEVDHTPVSDGERIFVSGKKGTITALDLKGTKLWEKTFTRKKDTEEDVPVRFDAPLACGQGLVFAGTRRGLLYALDAKTGATTWTYNTGGIVMGSPNILDERTIVVVDQSDGALHGIDLETGKLLWKTDGQERCDGSPGVGWNDCFWELCGGVACL